MLFQELKKYSCLIKVIKSLGTSRYWKINTHPDVDYFPTTAHTVVFIPYLLLLALARFSQHCVQVFPQQAHNK